MFIILEFRTKEIFEKNTEILNNIIKTYNLTPAEFKCDVPDFIFKVIKYEINNLMWNKLKKDDYDCKLGDKISVCNGDNYHTIMILY